MRKNIKWIVPLFLLVVIAAVYLLPVPRVPFDQVYAKVDSAQSQSLQSFRAAHPAKILKVNGVKWEYVAFGKGQETILFLHGMTGAYDIWWNQMEALQNDYRVISVTYPAVDSLGEMSDGVFAILDAEEWIKPIS